jgi:hypothetical protein
VTGLPVPTHDVAAVFLFHETATCETSTLRPPEDAMALPANILLGGFILSL